MIRVEKLSVQLGSFAIENISFEVGQGQYAILMGRTGTGKTTLLESICGLRPISTGRVELMGRDVTDLKPAERNIGFVPQEGALFEGMRIRDQIGFALTIRKWKKQDIEQRVGELADLLGVEHLLNRKPYGLSGGERQRVALGRALAAQPGVLCLDEPLSALDDATRDDMYRLLKSVREHTGVTTLHITHSKSEASHLGDVVFVIKDGKVHRVTGEEDSDRDLPLDDAVRDEERIEVN